MTKKYCALFFALVFLGGAPFALRAKNVTDPAHRERNSFLFAGMEQLNASEGGSAYSGQSLQLELDIFGLTPFYSVQTVSLASDDVVRAFHNVRKLSESYAGFRLGFNLLSDRLRMGIRLGQLKREDFFYSGDGYRGSGEIDVTPWEFLTIGITSAIERMNDTASRENGNADASDTEELVGLVTGDEISEQGVFFHLRFPRIGNPGLRISYRVDRKQRNVSDSEFDIESLLVDELAPTEVPEEAKQNFQTRRDQLVSASSLSESEANQILLERYKEETVSWQHTLYFDILGPVTPLLSYAQDGEAEISTFGVIFEF